MRSLLALTIVALAIVGLLLSAFTLGLPILIYLGLVIFARKSWPAESWTAGGGDIPPSRGAIASVICPRQGAALSSA